jgi:hypothetical protein
MKKKKMRRPFEADLTGVSRAKSSSKRVRMRQRSLCATQPTKARLLYRTETRALGRFPASVKFCEAELGAVRVGPVHFSYCPPQENLRKNDDFNPVCWRGTEKRPMRELTLFCSQRQARISGLNPHGGPRGRARKATPRLLGEIGDVQDEEEHDLTIVVDHVSERTC